MRDAADLARRYGARLHTHLAETNDEDDFCVQIVITSYSIHYTKLYEIAGGKA